MQQLMPGFVQQVQMQCDKCGGKGKIVSRKCAVCGGKKVERGSTQLEVPIEKGMPDGESISFDVSYYFPYLFLTFTFLYTYTVET